MLHVVVRGEDWRKLRSVRAVDGSVHFGEIAELRGVPAVYLLEAFDRNGTRCRAWYVGETGNLEDRLKRYVRESTGAVEQATTTTQRVGSRFRRWLEHSGTSATLSVIENIELELPERVFDDDDRPLTIRVDVGHTPVRLLVESSAVVQRAESMHGSWEEGLNRLPRRPTTRRPRSILEDLVIEFPADDELGP